MPNKRSSNYWKWFSYYIRLRDTHKNGLCMCMTCDCVKPPKNMQAGHVWPKGSPRYKALEFNEMNVYAQCGGCNKYRMNYPEYKERAEAHARSKYGDKAIDNMLAMARTASSKLSQFEIEIRTKAIKIEVERLLEEKRIEKWWKHK